MLLQLKKQTESGFFLPFGFTAMPRAVAQKFVVETLSSRPVIAAAATAPASGKGPADMVFSYSVYHLVGRGGEYQAPTKEKITSIDNDFSGKAWNGGDASYSSFQVDYLKTLRLAGGVQYTGYLRSYVRGGHRDANWPVTAEDQTSTIRYSLAGSAVVPRCEDIAKCKPMVWISLGPVTTPGDSESNTEIILKQGGTEFRLTPGKMQLVDVAVRQAEIIVRLSRDKTHVGACCEPGWFAHYFNVSVLNQQFPAPAPVFQGAPFATWPPQPEQEMAAEDRRRMRATRFAGAIAPRLDPPQPDEYRNYGEVLADEREIQDLDVSERFWVRYLRLLMADWLKREEFKKTSAEVLSIERARNQLSSEAKEQYRGHVSAMLQTYKSVLDFIDTKPLDLAIEMLLRGEPMTQLPDPLLLDKLAALSAAGVLADRTPLEDLLKKFATARGQDNVLDALLTLIEFRRNYAALVEELRVQARLLALEEAVLK